LTGLGCVSRVYTDLAIMDVTPAGLRVAEIVDGLTPERLQEVTGKTGVGTWLLNVGKD
jgi:3-oxoadipate CoA-transferase beta subunit